MIFSQHTVCSSEQTLYPGIINRRCQGRLTSSRPLNVDDLLKRFLINTWSFLSKTTSKTDIPKQFSKHEKKQNLQSWTYIPGMLIFVPVSKGFWKVLGFLLLKPSFFRSGLLESTKINLNRGLNPRNPLATPLVVTPKKEFNMRWRTLRATDLSDQS